MPTIRVVDDNVIEFVDSNGDVAAREEYDEAASEVSFVDGDGNPMSVSLGDAAAESVSTGEINNRVRINPDISDVGAGINDAISEFAPAPVAVQIPYGQPWGTQVDLSDGVNGQQLDTTVVIKGYGGPDFPTGESLDCSNINSSPIYQSGNRSGIHLRGFGLKNVPQSIDGIRIGDGGYCTGSTIHDVTVQGGKRPFYLADMYASTIEKLRARGGYDSAKLEKMNAATLQTVEVRQSNTDDVALWVDGGLGMSAQGIYIESNQGSGLATTGTLRGSTLGGLYFENNNTGGNASREVILGDSSLSGLGGTPSRYTIDGAKFAGADNFGSEKFTLDDTRQATIQSVHATNTLDMYATGNFYGRCTFIQCGFGAVDDSNATFPSAWIETESFGTDSRQPFEYEDITSSRSLGTWYTNTTGYTQEHKVRVQNDGGGIQVLAQVDSGQAGETVDSYRNDNTPTTHRATVTFTVPPNQSYRVRNVAGSSLTAWRRLERVV